MSTAARISRSPDSITREIIRAAMKVHTAVGPGLLESAYEAFLSFELEITQRLCDLSVTSRSGLRDLRVRRSRSLPAFPSPI